jgi:hypothetical protein
MFDFSAGKLRAPAFCCNFGLRDHKLQRKAMSIEDCIINVYCLVDGEVKKLIGIGAKQLRSQGFEPTPK